MDSTLTLLLVDSNVVDCQAIRQALHSAERSVVVTEAASRASALALLEAQIFDCVLLDYSLPDADALSVVVEIRARGNSAPIVVLIDEADEPGAGRLIKAGANDYLTKAELSPLRLVQRVTASVRTYKAEREAECAHHDGVKQLHFQHEASQILASSLDQLTTLTNLMRLLVPHFADWCAVRLLDSEGNFQQICVYPEANTQAWSAALMAQLKLSGHSAIDAEVIDAGDALAFPSLAESPLKLAPIEVVRLSEAGLSTLLCVPVVGYGWVMGTLILARYRGRPVFTPADLSQARDLAQRLAMALHNSYLYRQSQLALKLRDEFVAITAHELRTPLTSLLGYVQLLERRMHHEGGLVRRDERILRTIVEQGTRLNNQITRLIDLAHLRRGDFRLERRPLDLGATLTQLVERLQSGFKQHMIELMPLEQRYEVLGDEQRLIQAFEHLLHNAVQYSPNNGHIVMRMVSDSDWVHIGISDKGIGIPQEALPYLFRRFYRARNADDLALSGIGLGLYIVSEIITLHGGEITVQSKLSQGSSFTVHLPLLRRV
jgi:signal transduction histidine kinase/DNA-binding response OmpR family regulator